MAEVVINPGNQKVAVMSTEKVDFYRPVHISELSGNSGKFDTIFTSEIHSDQAISIPGGIATKAVHLDACSIVADGETLSIDAKTVVVGQLAMDHGNNTIPNLEVTGTLKTHELEASNAYLGSVAGKFGKFDKAHINEIGTDAIISDKTLVLQDADEGTLTLKTLNDRIPVSLGQNKGDIVCFYYENTPMVLPVGKPGQVLVSDPSSSSGLSWKFLSEITQ